MCPDRVGRTGKGSPKQLNTELPAQKTMERVALFLILTVVFLQKAAAVKPGANIRVTRKGLSYAGEIGANALRKQIQTTSIPSYAGHQPLIKYNFSNINISGVGPLHSYIPQNLSTSLTWVIKDAGFHLTADFSLSFCLFRSQGTVVYSVGNSSFYLPLSIGVDNAGRPTVTATSCRLEVDSSSLIFYGQHAGFFNFLARTFKGKFLGFFQKMVCTAFRTEVNKGADQYFSKYQVNKTLGPLFTVDYSLVSQPSYNATYMEVLLVGETFWTKKRGNSSVPIPQLPPFGAKTRMVYFVLTDYVLNSLGQVAFRQELLQKVLTYKDLPRDQQYFFNTTCPGNLCFGKLIAQTAVMFPHSRAELHMKTSERPVFTVSQSSLDVSFATNIIFYMRRPNGNSTYIFSIKTKLDIQLHAMASDISTKGRLTAAINQTSLSVGILNSDIGAINLNLLNTLMDTIVSLYIRPQLNRLGAFGFPLPLWSKTAHLQNIQIIQAQNALIIGADVKNLNEAKLRKTMFGPRVAAFDPKGEDHQRSFQGVDGHSGHHQQPIQL